MNNPNVIHTEWGNIRLPKRRKEKRPNSNVEYHIDEKGQLLKASCLDYKQLHDYLHGFHIDFVGTALHIEDLEIFDKPKTLADYGLKRAPESWCYSREKNNV